MSELKATLERLSAHQGVEHVILLGRDGLLVQFVGDRERDIESIAARVPGLASAANALGTIGDQGPFRTAVLEYDAGVAIVISLSDELLLAVLVRSGVGFADLLRNLRRERARLVDVL